MNTPVSLCLFIYLSYCQHTSPQSSPTSEDSWNSGKSCILYYILLTLLQYWTGVSTLATRRSLAEECTSLRGPQTLR